MMHACQFYFFVFVFSIASNLLVHDVFRFFVPTNQEYTEEFREITGKSKKSAGGTIADGSITLINQRHVGDDLPVKTFFIFIPVLKRPHCV